MAEFWVLENIDITMILSGKNRQWFKNRKARNDGKEKKGFKIIVFPGVFKITDEF